MTFCDCVGEPAAAAGGCPQSGAGPGHGAGYPEPGPRRRLCWPLLEDLDDGRLEVLLFPPPSGTLADQRPVPDWAWVHRELRRPDVTLALL